MNTPIITERILERYLLASGADVNEVRRALGLSADIEHKITEGYWIVFGESDGSLKEHEYHAALACCAMAEMAHGLAESLLAQSSSQFQRGAVHGYREMKHAALREAGIAEAAWEATR